MPNSSNCKFYCIYKLKQSNYRDFSMDSNISEHFSTNSLFLVHLQASFLVSAVVSNFDMQRPQWYTACVLYKKKYNKPDGPSKAEQHNYFCYACTNTSDTTTLWYHFTIFHYYIVLWDFLNFHFFPNHYWERQSHLFYPFFQLQPVCEVAR